MCVQSFTKVSFQVSYKIRGVMCHETHLILVSTLGCTHHDNHAPACLNSILRVSYCIHCSFQNLTMLLSNMFHHAAATSFFPNGALSLAGRAITPVSWPAVPNLFKVHYGSQQTAREDYLVWPRCRMGWIDWEPFPTKLGIQTFLRL